MNKRIISMFLALLMFISSFLPQTTTVFAGETTESNLGPAIENVNPINSKAIVTTSEAATSIKILETTNEESNRTEEIEVDTKPKSSSKEDYQAKIDDLYTELSIYYANDYFSSWGKTITLAYTNGGGSIETAKTKVGTFSPNNLYTIYQGVFNILALDLDPRKFEDDDGNIVDYARAIENFQKNDGNFSSDIELNMRTLQAAKIACAAIDDEQSVDYLISRLITTDNQAHYNSKIKETAWILMSLCLHSENNDAKNLIPKCVNWLKDQQNEDASFGANSETTAIVARALTNAGEDIFSNDYVKEKDNRKITVLDYIYNCKTDNGEIREYPSPNASTKSKATLEVYTLLSELQHKNSMFSRYTANVGTITSEIKLSDNSLTLIEGQIREISARAYDDKGLIVPKAKFKWMSSDESIASIDNGIVTAHHSGIITLSVMDKSNNKIQATIQVTVEKELVTKIEIRENSNEISKLNLLKGETKALELIAYNQKNEIISSPNYEVKLIQENKFLSNEDLIFTSIQVGSGKIEISIGHIKEIIDFSVMDIEAIAIAKLNDYKSILINKQSLNDFDLLVAGAHGIVDELDKKNIKLKNLSCKVGNYTETPIVYGGRIYSLLAQNKDPYTDNGIDIVNFLVGSQQSKGYFYTSSIYYDSKADRIAGAMLGLDAIQAEYDIDNSIKSLISTLIIRNGKASIYRGWSDNYEKIMLITAALSNHRDIDGIDELLMKVENYLTFEFQNNTLKGEKLGQIAIAFNALNKPLDTIYKDVEGQSTSMLELLCKDNQNRSEVYAGILGHVKKQSIYQLVHLSVGEPVTIDFKLIDDKQLLKIDSMATYSIELKDSEDKRVKDFEYTIESLTADIISIDKKNKQLTGKKLGKTDIKISIIGSDLVVIQPMEVIIPKVIRTELNPISSELLLQVSKRLKFNPISFDTDIEKIPFKSEWRITPSTAGHMEANTFVAEEEGNVKIEYIVTNEDNSLLTTSIELKILGEDYNKVRAQQAIKETYKSIESNEEYDYLDALALRNAGFDLKRIQEKKNIYNTAGIHSTSRNVMTLIGANIDPKVKKDTIEGLAVDGLSEQQYYSKLLIALDMMNSKIDRETIINEISKTIKTSGNQKYIEISVKEYDSYLKEDIWVDRKYPEETLWTWIALSKYKDVDGVVEILTGIENYIIAMIDENLLVDDDSELTALAIQGIISNGYSIDDGRFTKRDSSGNKMTLIDGLLSCQKEGKFVSSLKASFKMNTTNYAINALSDYIAGDTTFSRIKYIKVERPSKIKIESSQDSYVEGDTVTFTAGLYSQEDVPALDEVIEWSFEPADMITVKHLDKAAIDIQLIKSGPITIKATSKKYTNLNKSISIDVKPFLYEGKYDVQLKNEIDFLKKIYNERNEKYEFLGGPAATGAGISQTLVKNNMYHYSKMTNITNVSKQIVACIGAGVSPRAYKGWKSEQNINLVDLLIEKQETSGDAIGQFAFMPSDLNRLNYNALSIIALDMAQGDYDKENAIKALMSLVDIELNTHSKNEAEYLGLSLIALAPHKQMNGVEESISKIKERLQKIQNEDAGFNASGGQEPNAPRAIGAVIQGLIAVGENPLEDIGWVKNRKTMLDALLLTKHQDLKVGKSGYRQHTGVSMINSAANYHAYAAISDLYNGKSMFVEQRLDKDTGVVTDKVVTKLIPKGDRWVNNTIKLCRGERFILEATAYNSKNQLIKNANIKWTVTNENLIIENNNELIAKNATIEPIILTISVDNKGTIFKQEVSIHIEEEYIKKIELQSPHTLFKTKETVVLNPIVYNQFNLPMKSTNVTYQIETKTGSNVAQLNEETGEIEFLSAGTIDVTAAIKKTDDTLIQSSTITLKAVEPISKTVFVSIYGVDASGKKKVVHPLKSLSVDNFDLGAYGDGSRQFYESPVAMNALIKRLEMSGLNCHEKETLNVLADLSFLKGIEDLGNDSPYPNSGWVYYLNNNYSSNKMNEQALNDGDHINVFYVLDYENINYYSITPNSETIGKNQNLKVTLNKKVKIPNTDDYKVQPVENATITIDGIDALFEGKIVTTDKLGQATITFEQDGEYLISAKLANHIETAIPPAYLVKVQDSSLMKNIEMTYKNFETLKAGYESSFNFSFKSLSEEAQMVSYEVALFENDKLIQQIHLSRKAFKDITISEKITFLLPDSEDLSIKLFYVDSSGNKELIKSHKIKE